MLEPTRMPFLPRQDKGPRLGLVQSSQMPNELTPEQKFAVEDESIVVPRALLQGRSSESIVEELVARDWEYEAALSYVQRFEAEIRLHQSPESRQQLRRYYARQAVVGLLLFLLGSLFTAFTMFAWLIGSFPLIVIAWGAVVVVAILFCGGVYRYSDIRVRFEVLGFG